MSAGSLARVNRQRVVAFFTVAWLAAACSTVRPVSDSRAVASAWVELVPGGSAEVRVIAEDTTCPSLIVDGGARPMQVRASSDGGKFPVTVCAAPLPAGARSAAVDGQALPLPNPSPRRILVIGDTGCRMKAPSDFQACNDPTAWPFAQVAARAAAWRPDLVIHLGDYHYRESPCPAGNAGCAGNPVGDAWPSWRADFFTPAAPLLRAAPWVVIRGNHESCSRAGQGWFRFLEPRPRPASCADNSDPYVVPLGGTVLAVLDSSAASDDSAPPADVARYAAQLDQLAAMTPAYTWLLTHRPVWGVVNFDGQTSLGNLTLQAAGRGKIPAAVTLLLAGHVHLFEGLGFAAPRPPIMIVGNGGTALDDPITQRLPGMTIDGATVTAGKAFRGFGYVTLEPAAAGWRVTVHDADGRPVSECALAGKTLACAP
jgi:calcineurin-like phosphoesterase family protein